MAVAEEKGRVLVARNYIKLRGETLVTWYILPLVGTSKGDFTRSFLTTLVNKEGTKIYLQIKEDLKSLAIVQRNPNYLFRVYIGRDLFVVFAVPKTLKPDVRLILNGKYSEINKTAKNLIYTKSGLKFKKKVGDHVHSDYILQALDKTRTLRALLSEFFDVPIDAIKGEYIYAFKPEWYIESTLEKLKR